MGKKKPENIPKPPKSTTNPKIPMPDQCLVTLGARSLTLFSLASRYNFPTPCNFTTISFYLAFMKTLALQNYTYCTITMAGLPCQKKKKKKKKKKGKADLTIVLHIRELPHLHMKLAVWFSFPTTNNKNPMIPSWSLVSIYNYSFNPDQIYTKNFKILKLEICSKSFTCGMIFLLVNSSLPKSLKKYVLSQ